MLVISRFISTETVCYYSWIYLCNRNSYQNIEWWNTQMKTKYLSVKFITSSQSSSNSKIVIKNYFYYVIIECMPSMLTDTDINGILKKTNFNPHNFVFFTIDLQFFSEILFTTWFWLKVFKRRYIVYTYSLVISNTLNVFLLDFYERLNILLLMISSLRNKIHFN